MLGAIIGDIHIPKAVMAVALLNGYIAIILNPMVVLAMVLPCE